VVVFGEIGVGKSSVINMIADNPVATTSADGLACTFESMPSNVTLNNKRIRLWDTVGLPEGEMGTIATENAIIHLYYLLKGLEDGVSLLVYCMRAPTVRSRDYKMFYDGLCQRKVPIILVVTGLEGENCMEDWWDRNEGAFEKQQMSFDGHACITATKGKWRDNEHVFAREYEESSTAVRQLILQHCSEDMLKAEKPHLDAIGIAKVMFNIGTRAFHIPPLVLGADLYKVLVKQGGYSDGDARAIANKAEIGVIRNAGGWLPGGNSFTQRR
jgi:GTPase Era involved in 16S rRNA processing